ncbi:MAG: ABC transporter substrate-binding protein [Deltaproteobacteria bacterium]|nr:ABC transporter substrate-binding protein [Deltaproteobacteria bacterium]
MLQILARLALAALLGLAALSLAACSQEPVQEAEIKVGLVISLSGEQQQVGQQAVQAARLLAETINEAGGLKVAGRQHKLVLVIEDNQDQAQVAVAVAHKLINQKGVVAIIGPNLSRNAVPVAMAAEKARIPMISPASTNPQTTAGKKYVFRACFIDSFQGLVMARFAREDLGASRAAVLFDAANVYNQTLAHIFKDVFEKAGGRVVAFEAYTTGDQDFGGQLERIKKTRPEVLFLPNYFHEVPLQVDQALHKGIKTLFLGSDSWDSMKAADWLKLEGSFFSSLWAPDLTDEKTRLFIEAYEQAYGQAPASVAAMTYDSLGLLIKAIETQGQVDPESIRAGLAGLDSFLGVSGSISFQGGNDPVKSVPIMKVSRGQARFFKVFGP